MVDYYKNFNTYEGILSEIQRRLLEIGVPSARELYQKLKEKDKQRLAKENSNLVRRLRLVI